MAALTERRWRAALGLRLTHGHCPGPSLSVSLSLGPPSSMSCGMAAGPEVRQRLGGGLGRGSAYRRA